MTDPASHLQHVCTRTCGLQVSAFVDVLTQRRYLRALGLQA